jgi:hypothetical protein
MRTGLLLNGRMEPITPKEGRLAKGVISATRLAKKSPGTRDESVSIDTQICQTFMALMASKMAREETQRNRKPKVRRFRIPLKLS